MCKAPPDSRIAEASIGQAWDEISVETLRKIVDDFPKQLKACVEAEGGHFE
jgi:hypothetical protein